MKRFAFVAAVLLAALLTIAASAQDVTGPEVAQAQTCTPPLYQGYPSGCAKLQIRWLNRDQIALIDRFEIYRGGRLIGTAPAHAIEFSDPIGCGAAAVYTIRQVMKSGASCQTVTSGPNAPHTKPCDQCQGVPGAAPVFIDSVQNSASGKESLTRNMIAAAYAKGLTSGIQSAGSLPLPLSLAGVSIKVNGVPCGMFFADQSQSNFLIPPEIPNGPALIELRGTDGVTRILDVQIFEDRPGVFTWASGEAAANYGENSADPQSFVAVLYATGINERNRLKVKLRIEGRDYSPLWLGDSPEFLGLTQLNFILPLHLKGRRIASARLTVNSIASNTFDLAAP